MFELGMVHFMLRNLHVFVEMKRDEEDSLIRACESSFIKLLSNYVIGS